VMADEDLTATWIGGKGSEMDWADAFGCVLEIVPPLLEVLFDRTVPEHTSKPSPRIDTDNWKCPPASEFARVLGASSRSRDEVDCTTNREPASTSKENPADGLSSTHGRADPLWDRELDF
jgi:hypothetical protein